MNEKKLTALFEKTITLDSKDVHPNVLATFEKTMLRTLMESCRYNQALVSRILGISRGGTIAKLKHYFGDEFVGQRNV